jgi:hypothetical protein
MLEGLILEWTDDERKRGWFLENGKREWFGMEENEREKDGSRRLNQF